MMDAVKRQRLEAGGFYLATFYLYVGDAEDCQSRKNKHYA
jgi:hypothetical protein